MTRRLERRPLLVTDDLPQRFHPAAVGVSGFSTAAIGKEHEMLRRRAKKSECADERAGPPFPPMIPMTSTTFQSQRPRQPRTRSSTERPRPLSEMCEGARLRPMLS